MTKIIIRDQDGNSQHDATGYFDIVIGEGIRRLNISVTQDGWVRVRAMDCGDLEVRPEANNALRVKALPWADATQPEGATDAA